MPVEGLGGHEPAVGVEILGCGRAAEQIAELAEGAEQLILGCKPPRHQSGETFGPVPAAEMLDHRLRVHRRLLVGGELAHGRRPSESLRARAELGQDLLVRVPLADSGLECRERLGIDARKRPIGLTGHAISVERSERNASAR